MAFAESMINSVKYTVMILAFKDANTNGSIHLCYLFYMLSMIMIFNYICTTMHLYTIVMCTDDAIMNMYLCMLLVATCVVCYWLGMFYY